MREQDWPLGAGALGSAAGRAASTGAGASASAEVGRRSRSHDAAARVRRRVRCRQLCLSPGQLVRCAAHRSAARAAARAGCARARARAAAGFQSRSSGGRTCPARARAGAGRAGARGTPVRRGRRGHRGRRTRRVRRRGPRSRRRSPSARPRGSRRGSRRRPRRGGARTRTPPSAAGARRASTCTLRGSASRPRGTRCAARRRAAGAASGGSDPARGTWWAGRDEDWWVVRWRDVRSSRGPRMLLSLVPPPGGRVPWDSARAAGCVARPRTCVREYSGDDTTQKRPRPHGAVTCVRVRVRGPDPCSTDGQSLPLAHCLGRRRMHRRRRRRALAVALVASGRDVAARSDFHGFSSTFFPFSTYTDTYNGSRYIDGLPLSSGTISMRIDRGRGRWSTHGGAVVPGSRASAPATCVSTPASASLSRTHGPSPLSLAACPSNCCSSLLLPFATPARRRPCPGRRQPRASPRARGAAPRAAC